MKTRIIYLLIAFLATIDVMAQPKDMGTQPKGMSGKQADSWQVTVNTMDVSGRQKITKLVEDMQERGGATRRVVSDLLNIAKANSITTMIDVVSTEVINWANYRKTQKKEWMRMIEKENNYVDSISSIEGLHDFYSQTSRYGALDPSNINFNGISIRGIHEGKEFIYLSCHIDTTRLEHLFHHSKFYLVVDSIAFNPYECHLPNIAANGIRGVMGNEELRNNRFSFEERESLTFGMELLLSSSWMNELAVLQQNVPLGSFKLNVNIPSGVDVYKYSRREILNNRQRMKHNLSLNLDTTFVHMEGDCFVVPRSFMPISGTEPMWGTGAYDIKVRFNEKCRFIQDSKRNMRYKRWHNDYKQLRKLQKRDNEVVETVRNIWQQNGNTMIKTIVKQYLTNATSGMGGASGASSKMTGGTMGGMMPGNGASAAGGGMGIQGGMPNAK